MKGEESRLGEIVKVGFAKTTITPPVGVPLAGYAARKDVSKKVHDDLYARCVVFKQDDEVFAVVSHDLIGVPRALYKRVLERVENLGLSEDNLVMTATHTHSGPILTNDLIENIALKDEKCVREAFSALREVRRVKWSIGNVEREVLNRRDPEKGLKDPRLHIVELETESKPVILTNVTAHAVVLGPSNLDISADYPGAYIRDLEKDLDADAVFLQGCCGDINPTIGSHPEKVYERIGSFEDVEHLGRILADEAEHDIVSAKEEAPSLKHVSVPVELETYEFPDLNKTRVEAEKLRRELETARSKGDLEAERELCFKLFEAERILAFARIYGTSGKLSTRVYAVKLSESTAIVFLPGEVLVKLGLEIKRNSPFENTIVVAYTNDYLGYVPPAEEYDRGGYEARFPVTILKKGSAEKLVEYALRALKNIK
ncbi:MAG TPA: hypothetical protein ENF55_01930 [Thermoprotei archaeon]|nr:hypothetical protein [Thermoprotei archaeon]